MRRLIGVVLAGAVLVACNNNRGGGSGSPTGPSTTVTSITVNGSADLARGAARAFTATATMSGGGTQAVSGGTWGSDNPAVVTITADGQASAVGLGFATVFVDFQGVRGTLLMRVLQSFAGEYLGMYTVNACTATGDWIAVDACGDPFTPGDELPVSFLFTQNGAALNGQTALGGIISGNFTATVREDGGVTIQATANLSGIIFTETWELRADVPGRVTGTLHFVITEPSVTGNTTVDATVNEAVLVLPSTSRWQGPRSATGGLEALASLVRQRMR